MTCSRRRLDVLRAEFVEHVHLRVADLVRRTSNSPLFRERCERNYEARLTRHRSALPVLNAADESLARRLEIAHIASREVHLGHRAQNEVARAVQWLKNNRAAEAVSYLPFGLVDQDAALFRWGLSESNLDIAERHIGLPIRYLGLEVKRERFTPARTRQPARRWHLDAEDRRMLKVIVFLNDVDIGTGPFEYLSPSASDVARKQLRCRPGITFLPDTAVAAVVPQTEWRSVTGPAGTALYADTGRLLHRIKEPVERDRYSVTFIYSSNRPYHAFSRFMPPRSVVKSVAETLTSRQLRALPGT